MYDDISIRNKVLDNRRAISFYLTQKGFNKKHLASLADTPELLNFFNSGVVTALIRLSVASSSMPMEIFAAQCMEAEQTYSALLAKKSVKHISHCTGAGVLVFHLFPQKCCNLPETLSFSEEASNMLAYAYPHLYTSSKTADAPEDAHHAFIICLDFLNSLPLYESETAKLSTSDFQIQDRIKQAIMMMEENCCDSRLSIEWISNAMHLTPSHFCKIFKEETGVSPLSFLTDLRIEHAKKLLSSGDNQVGYVAAASGYESCEYFCRVFRKKTGMTPSQFRSKGLSFLRQNFIC